MLIINFRNHKSNRQKKKIKTKRCPQNYSERLRIRKFRPAFKLDSFQSICKPSLIFTSNLELALAIILKERRLCSWKHAVLERKCIKTKT